MPDEEMVEVWVECIACPQRSPSKYKPKGDVEKAEAMGLELRPAIGLCPDCQETMRHSPHYGDGVFN